MDSYQVEIDNRAKREIRELPGHMPEELEDYLANARRAGGPQ